MSFQVNNKSTPDASLINKAKGHPGRIQTASRPGKSGRSAHLAEVSCGVEAAPPSEDKGVCLAFVTSTPDDKVHVAAHGPRCSSGMPTVRWGYGGLPTLVLCLPLSPDCVGGDGSRPPRGELGGGILTVSRRRYISSRR